MLTRKHFEALAAVAAKVRDPDDREAVVARLVWLCSSDNPGFKSDLFRRRVQQLYNEEVA